MPIAIPEHLLEYADRAFKLPSNIELDKQKAERLAAIKLNFASGLSQEETTPEAMLRFLEGEERCAHLPDLD